MKYNKEYNKEHIKLTGDIAKKVIAKLIRIHTNNLNADDIAEINKNKKALSK
jgi:hypothetical protein